MLAGVDEDDGRRLVDLRHSVQEPPGYATMSSGVRRWRARPQRGQPREGKTLASFTKIAVLGLGNVGGLAAELLAEAGLEVTGFDTRPITDELFPTAVADLGDRSAVSAALDGQEAVLSCLPYALNKGIASAAHDRGIHYFDLTEDVPTTKHIRTLAATAIGIMVPQCARSSTRRGDRDLRRLDYRQEGLPDRRSCAAAPARGRGQAGQARLEHLIFVSD
jgi:Saccharopine dehydrogenase NADP binding domain